jgi:hypothetical protein
VKNKSPTYSSLEEFAASKPVLNDLIKMADELVQTYVANYKLQRIRRRPEKERDVQFENSLLMNKYFLLYKELSYAMNRGDIGRTETCIVAWIPILKATGKHKYATHMSNFLNNLHFVYPPGLWYICHRFINTLFKNRRAICYHILVNPKGKETSWRVVDWCVELNNLFTKVKNGGKGPNRTVKRIFLKSPLVHAYRNAQTMIQKNFLLAHLTVKHAGPNMRQTFELLSIQLAKQSPHIPTPGGKSRFLVVDLIDKGREMMGKAARGKVDEEEEGMDAGEGRADLDDVLVELV